MHDKKRLYFIDNIRVFLIMLVVAHHAGQPYGPTGGQWPLFETERSAILGPFFGVNAAFFMGLFFLISGYFLPGAFLRKGAWLFMKDRLLRLGVPIIFFALVLFPPFAYYLMYLPQGGRLSFLPAYLELIIVRKLEFAHMWFIVHLLVYAIGYTVWRMFVPKKNATSAIGVSVPTHVKIFFYTLILGVVTAFVRIWFPIDKWVRLLWIIPTEIAHLPQYFSLFVIGIVAFRRDWLTRLPTATGKSWLWIGFVSAGARYIHSLWGWQFLPSITASGGLDWRSLVYSTWEAFICVGLCVGLLTLFRERFYNQGKMLTEMSSAAYTVYIIHLHVIIGLQFALANCDLTPFVKFSLVTLLGIPLCFGLSYLIKKLPFTKRIL